MKGVIVKLSLKCGRQSTISSANPSVSPIAHEVSPNHCLQWSHHLPWKGCRYWQGDKKYQEEYYSNLIGDSFDKTYDGFVCRDNMGKLITPAYVTTHFKLMVDSNGLKHLRFHDLRHSCASLWVASGVPMKAVQEWLGHATYNITADYYSHLDFRSKMASADTISKLLDGNNLNGDTENKTA